MKLTKDEKKIIRMAFHYFMEGDGHNYGFYIVQLSEIVQKYKLTGAQMQELLLKY